MLEEKLGKRAKVRQSDNGLKDLEFLDMENPSVVEVEKALMSKLSGGLASPELAGTNESSVKSGKRSSINSTLNRKSTRSSNVSGWRGTFSTMTLHSYDQRQEIPFDLQGIGRQN